MVVRTLSASPPAFHAGYAGKIILWRRATLRIYLWVKDGARIGNHAERKRSLASIQVRSRLVKIILRCGLRAVDAITPLDNVR